ncbi:DUF393 domain-containing protein [Parahaliea maris]|uniref:DUF393 domain-containing protein n=1 Tax=Parahaliea maris TaxID=2716870 RepID=A0A5C9A0E4_9GAMM|nr:lipase maturation factor family protein [Parahaliea maris]TXS94228.1 DUF393 domain-containing protein [Parahaliea maris]
MDKTPAPDRPLLIYDGDCGFCRYCVDYARAVTGERVQYQPFQDVGSRFPEIGEQRFREAIYLVEDNGRMSRGAGAAFRTLELGGYLGLWARLYRALPLFAVISEWCYRRVANHRQGAARFSRWMFGEQLRPARQVLVGGLFLRLLALVYLAAFGSLTWQASGLIGEQGILPTEDYFAALDMSLGKQKYFLVPSFFWLGASTAAFIALGAAGCLLSLALLAGRATRVVLPLLYLFYLSLYHAGQRFTSYQWDALLLEVGFLAILLPWCPRLVSWLYRWVLFRFLLQSGLVKLLSGDPAWRHLSALRYHFETQPLPNVLAWYAHQLPDALLRVGAGFTLLVELIVPWLILMPRRPRQWAATLVVIFQLAITLTGSYNFFNLLTVGLCLMLLDDHCVERWLPRKLGRSAAGLTPRLSRARWLIYPLAGLQALLGALLLVNTMQRIPGDSTGYTLLYWSSPWQIANSYGPFAVMTTQRREIVFEGSHDGRHWIEYELPYKPGDPLRRPGWATPRQPRLDWQLWFAALQQPQNNPWVGRLVEGLLQGSPPVLALFSVNPFPEAPPRYVRASLYRYQFTTGPERQATGAWWRREKLGRYWPVTAWQLPVERAAPIQ